MGIGLKVKIELWKLKHEHEHENEYEKYWRTIYQLPMRYNISLQLSDEHDRNLVIKEVVALL